MIVRSLDSNGDWTFGKGKNDYLSGNKAIVQNISTRLKSFLGNCFFALDAGLDWFNLLGSKNKLSIELQVRSVILNTEGVSSLLESEVTVDPQTRRITMRYRVETVYTILNRTQAVTAVSNFLLTQSGDILTTEDGNPLATG